MLFNRESIGKIIGRPWEGHGLLLLCYCSHLPLLQVPNFPFEKPFEKEKCKGALPYDSQGANNGETIPMLPYKFPF